MVDQNKFNRIKEGKKAWESKTLHPTLESIPRTA